MKADYTDVTFLLDRTGSMQSIKSDIEGGFAALIADQRQLTGDDCRITLFQFDSDGFDVVFSERPVGDVGALVLQPRSMTPLYAAQCRAIDETGRRLATKAENQRPAKVIFVVMTDGLENHSGSVEWGQP